ncbi:MAG: hypothetical protein ACI90V_004036, partial [Bacillariaceae sp.]
IKLKIVESTWKLSPPKLQSQNYKTKLVQYFFTTKVSNLNYFSVG